MTEPDQEPMIDVARGDAALSGLVRDNLRVLRDGTGDPQVRRLLDRVLRGEIGLRDAFNDPNLVRALNPLIDRFGQWYETLSDAERDELAEDGERRLDERREQLRRAQRET